MQAHGFTRRTLRTTTSCVSRLSDCRKIQQYSSSHTAIGSGTSGSRLRASITWVTAIRLRKIGAAWQSAAAIAQKSEVARSARIFRLAVLPQRVENLFVTGGLRVRHHVAAEAIAAMLQETRNFPARPPAANGSATA